MKHLLIAAAVLASAGTANAQMTTCNTVGGTTTCMGSAQQAAPWGIVVGAHHYSAADCAAGVDLPTFAISRGAKRCRAIFEQRKAIGTLVADGKCDEAKAVALKAGDLALAQQVLGLCTPAASPAPAQ